MGRDTHFIAVGPDQRKMGATMIGENLALLEQIAANSDNIDYGELVYVSTGPGLDDGLTAFTSRGVESPQEFIADVRTWPGGIRQFLFDEGRDPKTIERIMADEPR